MAKRKAGFTGFNYLRAAHTGKIHVFDVIGYNQVKHPVCGFNVGPVTYPLSHDEVGEIDPDSVKSDKFCRACLERSTRITEKCRDNPALSA